MLSRLVVLLVLAVLSSCSRSATDFCTAGNPICPIGYSCVEDRCELDGTDGGVDGGISARQPRVQLRHARRAP